MSHHELTGGYVLGALSDAERRAFEAHLATCVECAQEVEALRVVTTALAYAAPPQDVPPDLRDRVLREAIALGRSEDRGFGRSNIGTFERPPVRTPEAPIPRISEAPIPRAPGSSSLPSWLAMAASIAAVALGLYAVTLRQRVEVLQDQLREATARAEDMSRQAQVAHAVADQARDASAVLAASDVRRIDLAGQAHAASATGRAFWSPSHARLVFTAANLPALPAGRQYQLWVVPPGQNAVSAGMLTLESDGRVTTLAPPLTVEQVAAVAVSDEPAGGVPSRTGPIVLVGTAPS
jgi:anti-sigma-K factor RskA/heme exporter protein D